MPGEINMAYYKDQVNPLRFHVYKASNWAAAVCRWSRPCSGYTAEDRNREKRMHRCFYGSGFTELQAYWGAQTGPPGACFSHVLGGQQLHWGPAPCNSNTGNVQRHTVLHLWCVLCSSHVLGYSTVQKSLYLPG